MDTYDFLVNDRSDERTIASTEAHSCEEALNLLRPWYEPHSLTWLRNDQEDASEEKGGSRWIGLKKNKGVRNAVRC
jgi:hypothetical protein